jgi:hypothetical protein
MGYRKLTILEKQIGTPREISVTARRIAAPTIIQPDYQFDVSDMLEIFVPEVSFNDNHFYWDAGIFNISSGYDSGKFVKESSLSTDFSWTAGLLKVIGGGSVKDASFGSTFKWTAGIVDVSDYISKTAVNASLNILFSNDIQYNASINDLYSKDIIQKIYIDGSLATRDASISLLFRENDIQDASIIRIDGSLNALFAKDIQHDVSITALFVENDRQDASIIRIDAVNAAQDVSIEFLNTQRYLHHLLDVSIKSLTADNVLQYNGSTGFWENRTPVEFTDEVYLRTAVDASFALIVNVNSSIGYLNSYVKDLSSYTVDISALYASKYIAFKDVSATYTITNIDINNVVETTGNITINLPDSLSTGFQTTIINTDGGTVTLNASTLLSEDSSIKLIKKYSAASAIHKGSGTWYAFGDLT